MHAFLSVLTIGLLAACGPNTAGSPGSGQTAPQRSSNVVTAEEIQRAGNQDLYDTLKRLRPAWFRSAPTTGMGGLTDGMVVYIDGQRMGGLAHLRDISPTAVLSVRYYSASEAQMRFGLDNLQGAIDVATTR